MISFQIVFSGRNSFKIVEFFVANLSGCFNNRVHLMYVFTLHISMVKCKFSIWPFSNSFQW